MRIGDEVKFEVRTDRKSGRLVGSRVQILPRGTLALESTSEVFYTEQRQPRCLALH